MNWRRGLRHTNFFRNSNQAIEGTAPGSNRITLPILPLGSFAFAGGDGCGEVTDSGDGCGVVTDGSDGCGVVTDGGDAG